MVLALPAVEFAERVRSTIFYGSEVPSVASGNHQLYRLHGGKLFIILCAFISLCSWRNSGNIFNVTPSRPRGTCRCIHWDRHGPIDSGASWAATHS